MAHLKIQPPGQVPLNPQDRKPIIKVIGGDSWHVSFNLYNPAKPWEPALPDNTTVEVKLAETQFDDALWSGEWYEGVMPDERRKGLCHINVPREITESLRRGSYMFSVRVTDILKTKVVTEAEGSFLVEYKVTSDQHSIPYKDGTSGSGTKSGTTESTSMSELENIMYLIKKEIMDIKQEQKEMLSSLAGLSEDMRTANENIDVASTTATEANTTAAEAEATAEEALTVAGEAASAATGAVETAEQALSKAEQALTIAEDANSIADAADNRATAAENRATAVENLVGSKMDKVQGVVAGNIAVFDTTGGVKDSGRSIAYMQTVDAEEAEYVVFNGTQYVDLGIKANQSAIKIEFEITPALVSPWPQGVNGTYYAVLGSRNSATGAQPSGNICNAFLSNTGGFRPDMVGGKSEGTIAIKFDEKCTILLERGRAVVKNATYDLQNGYTYTPSATTVGDQPDLPGSFILGSMVDSTSGNLGPTSSFAWYMGCWGKTKIFWNGSLLFDLIPVRKKEENNYVGFFYDRISGKLFGSAVQGHALGAGPVKS